MLGFGKKENRGHQFTEEERQLAYDVKKAKKMLEMGVSPGATEDTIMLKTELQELKSLVAQQSQAMQQQAQPQAAPSALQGIKDFIELQKAMRSSDKELRDALLESMPTVEDKDEGYTQMLLPAILQGLQGGQKSTSSETPSEKQTQSPLPVTVKEPQKELDEREQDALYVGSIVLNKLKDVEYKKLPKLAKFVGIEEDELRAIYERAISS